MLFIRALPISSYLTAAPAGSASLCSERILNATETLNQRWFDPNSGLWQGLWWNSGAILTTIGNVAQVCEDYRPRAERLISGIHDSAKALNGGNFLNDYYDDEGWWATGWIKAYDLTGKQKYLDTAVQIYADLVKGSDRRCGGIFWSKSVPYPAAIANELFLLTAASLANRIPNNSAFRDHAQNQVDWVFQSGLLNSDNTINDGLDFDTCEPRGQVFTYNQGVILGALVEMHKLTSNETYLDLASSIAHAAIEQLAGPHRGILSEPNTLRPPYDVGSATYNNDQQFKGVFVRNLMELQRVAPNDAFVDFLQRNADSIWKNDRQPDGQLGSLWQGPVVGLTAASQSSALDCLVAAAAVIDEVKPSASESETRTPTPSQTSTTTTTGLGDVVVETTVVVVTVTVTSG